MAATMAKLLTLAQVCERLQLSENSVRRLIARKVLCPVRLIRDLRFDPAHVEQVIHQRQEPAVEEAQVLPLPVRGLHVLPVPPGPRVRA